jgi:hypothetical protein
MALRRQCATMQVFDRLLETVPDLREKVVAIERRLLRSIETGQAMRMQRRLITIPTVVHVVYKSASQNISDAQIKSQISVLNKDFRAKNADKTKVPSVWKGMVADANIQFALAKKDPSGKATSGITRTTTTHDSFGDNDGVKRTSSGGISPWPSDRYLNLWVCNLKPWLGYAQFPGLPKKTDGVVITYKAFGTTGTATPPYNLGRTTTHEVGHWLNLRHIWADTIDCSGWDMVEDTPNCAGPNYGKPRFPKISCGNAPNGDMFMNYMDYTDDAAMYMFTPGQVVRMNATLAGPRKSFAS